MSTYIYQPRDRVSFAEGVQFLQQQGRTVIPQPVNITAGSVVDRIRELGRASGMDFQDFEIELSAFRSYCAAAGYSDRYAEYYPDNQHEKALEHFIALSLLKLQREDVFIDIASEHSPVAEIYGRLTGADTYSQDIMYAAGIDGQRIGGDACAMPIPDGFASAASLTCSLEHFEEDADVGLFVELARILRPGGSVCVVPFYVNVEHVVQTDPAVGVPANVIFDAGAPVYCAEGWGNRHGRFYSPRTFVDRIVKRVDSCVRFSFFHVRNAPDVHSSVYVRFAFLATRL